VEIFEKKKIWYKKIWNKLFEYEWLKMTGPNQLAQLWQVHVIGPN